jgi:predicted DCC family thiol-disulfide oxidoreductase YuxK
MRYFTLKPNKDAPIVFYDGTCGFCHTSVRKLLIWDKKKVFRFVSLQSESGRSLLDTTGVFASGQSIPDSLLVWDAQVVYVYFSAVTFIGKKLPCPFLWLGSLAQVLPGKWMDWAYRKFAKKRHTWFGHAPACWLPSEEDRARFLD